VEELEESWKNKVCRDGKNLCGLLLDFDLDRVKNKRTKKCRRVKSKQKLETQNKKQNSSRLMILVDVSSLSSSTLEYRNKKYCKVKKVHKTLRRSF
jgi:hypothetical protein